MKPCFYVLPFYTRARCEVGNVQVEWVRYPLYSYTFFSTMEIPSADKIIILKHLWRRTREVILEIVTVYSPVIMT